MTFGGDVFGLQHECGSGVGDGLGQGEENVLALLVGHLFLPDGVEYSVRRGPDLAGGGEHVLPRLSRLRLGGRQEVGEGGAEALGGAHEVVTVGALVVHQRGQHLDSLGHLGQVVGDGVDGRTDGVVVGVVALARQGDHLRRGRVHGRHLRVDALLVRRLLRLLPAVRGGVVAERRQFGLLVEEMRCLLDGLLPLADGRDERALRTREGELVRVLGLRGERNKWGFLGMRRLHSVSWQGLVREGQRKRRNRSGNAKKM